MIARNALRFLAASLAAASAVCLQGGSAAAFPHVVKAGETLAQIAERMYGRVEMEKLLVAANGLDVSGGIPVVPGMRLEVPAISHYRVGAGETWAVLAGRLLGNTDRGDVLAMSNDAMPWLNPPEGQEILIPYNLRVVATQGDSTLTIAYSFLGERDQAWMLDRYNHRKGEAVRRGDVLLVPLAKLDLTPEGKLEAASAGALVRAEGQDRARDAQKRADAELPTLASDVRGGRYVDAIARGNRLLGFGDLSRAQLATIQKELVEAYVAEGAAGLAETACAAWREADPAARLDPIELSPKIIRACTASVVAPTSPGAPALPSAPGGPNGLNAPNATSAPAMTNVPDATPSLLTSPTTSKGGR